jgi:hypothetical protein
VASVRAPWWGRRDSGDQARLAGSAAARWLPPAESEPSAHEEDPHVHGGALRLSHLDSMVAAGSSFTLRAHVGHEATHGGQQEGRMTRHIYPTVESDVGKRSARKIRPTTRVRESAEALAISVLAPPVRTRGRG